VRAWPDSVSAVNESRPGTAGERARRRIAATALAAATLGLAAAGCGEKSEPAVQPPVTTAPTTPTVPTAPTTTAPAPAPAPGNTTPKP
jgi:hypothetical protein